ncbi:MAG: 4Fe-4S dicluster domain-containing protein [Acidobacteriota bacterium]|jgi:heterodisulfide reductase subunit C|nr:4Fe-4S dicluster domain-containing protein [Acidobacteriota bacterium]
MIKTIVLDDKNVEFLHQVSDLSGQPITRCDQCGVCSGSCPLAREMDITPSQMMRKVQLGQEDVLESKAMWLCASCFTCTVRCPRGLDLAKVAEALRQISLRKAVDHIDINKIPREEMEILPQVALISSFRKFTG